MVFIRDLSLRGCKVFSSSYVSLLLIFTAFTVLSSSLAASTYPEVGKYQPDLRVAAVKRTVGEGKKTVIAAGFEGNGVYEPMGWPEQELELEGQAGETLVYLVMVENDGRKTGRFRLKFEDMPPNAAPIVQPARPRLYHAERKNRKLTRGRQITDVGASTKGVIFELKPKRREVFWFEIKADYDFRDDDVARYRFITASLDAEAWEVPMSDIPGDTAPTSSRDQFFVLFAGPKLHGPGIPTTPSVLAPVGDTDEKKPTYSWTVSEEAAAYELNVRDVATGASMLDRRVAASTVCSATTCEDTPPKKLSDGEYQWSVRARNSAGVSDWGSATFTVDTDVGGGGGQDEFDLSQATFLHTNVTDWKITSTLGNVTISDAQICMPHSMVGKWHNQPEPGSGVPVEGNPWVVANVNGQWYAAIFEWMGVNQICKSLGAEPPATTVATQMASHIKIAPLDTWVPQSGEKTYVLVSTVARYGDMVRLRERSQVVEVIWP